MLLLACMHATLDIDLHVSVHMSSRQSVQPTLELL